MVFKVSSEAKSGTAARGAVLARATPEGETSDLASVRD